MARASSEGSIYRRKDGRWVAAVTVYEGGKRKRRATYHATQAAAREHLTASTKSRDDGLPLPGLRLTVGAFLADWLETKATDLRPESLRRYRDSINLHLTPELGRRPLARLTPEDVQRCYARLRRKGLSATTVRLVHGTLHTALQQAMTWNLVQRNVAGTAFVKPPKPSTVKVRAITADEATRLLDAASRDPLEALYVTALTCGLRLGELQALRWSEVDFTARTITVLATFQGFDRDGEAILAEPKTERSRRNVHLSQLAIGALKAHRARQAQQRLSVGPLWQDRGFVFTNGLGRPIDGNNVRTRSFAPLLKRAGLPPMRFHDLRHAAATLLLAQGVNVRVIQEVLGHSDVTTTLRIYSHVLPSQQASAADAMDRLFARKG